ncbi:cation:proton antiporter family protein [Desulfogranum japonicum]|uniref:cation:proton antiporter family protein n=1 Tax=Desulfogranum japonicum TaxID=231447 RepID=UPI0003FAF13C|nr:cation:proton antiporter family protein [Desulfogranum japonicum]
MDATMLLAAFILGFLVKQIGLPPLLGFLAAGFALHGLGVEGGPMLQRVADTGIMLLLFSIGLKVRVKNLLAAEIWAVATLHMLASVVLIGAFITLLSYTAITAFSEINWQTALLLSFALSFSSTVFTVKVLEERGEMGAKHGRIAIGILILQDFFAVLFLTLSSGKLPSPWSICLFLLPLLKRPILLLIRRSGHGELQILLGFLIPFAAATLFEVFGVKPDLGALLIGMLLADDEKADELAKTIMGFKDLLLVGFFLTIGLSGMPTLSSLGAALLITCVIPIKVILFYLFLTRFKLRARTALFSSLNLATYSEFGLIVGALASKNNWISTEWLIVFALSISVSFIFASPLNSSAHVLYQRFRFLLKYFESKERLPDDRIVSIQGIDAAVFGMGRTGTAAYEVLRERYGKHVVGVDHDQEQVSLHKDHGRIVFQGDAIDYDFWERFEIEEGGVKVLLLAMPSYTANLYASERIKQKYANVTVASVVAFDDQIAGLKKAGADLVYNINSEAGKGFANHVCEKMENPAVHEDGSYM